MTTEAEIVYDCAGILLREAAVLSMLYDAWDRYGSLHMGHILVCHPFGIGVIRSWLRGPERPRPCTWENDCGLFHLAILHRVPRDEVWLVDSAQIDSQSSDREVAEILESTPTPNVRARIVNFSTSRADYPTLAGV